jgi:CheY-like chemotaxis protein
VRVIVVDDEPDARDVISRVLSRAGATAMAVGSVRDALDAVSRERPDVIVSDIAMPDQDGYDLVRQVKEMFSSNGGSGGGGSGGGGAIPALALTAYAREEDRLRCLGAGFQAHLAKPVDPGELLKVVSHLARATRPRPQEAQGAAHLRVG